MYVQSGRLVLSPTDLDHYLECRHCTQLDLEVATGARAAPTDADAALDMVARRGVEHEAAHLERLRSAGQQIVEVPADGGVEVAVAVTEQAMRAGVDVVYQATFLHDGWRGHADFLLKRPGVSSLLGDWAYDVADTKLARRIKVPAVLQMASYGEHLERIQGVPPEWLIVVTGDEREERVAYADCAAYFRRVRDRFAAEVAESPQPTYPHKVPFCSSCRWQSVCEDRRRADDHLSLVAGIRRDQIDRLVEAGIPTVEALAGAEPAALPGAIGEMPRQRLVSQARLQLVERRTGRPRYELLPPQPGRGLALLPAPAPGDLFFDIEGDPFVGDEGLEYLFGVRDSTGAFTAYWAHDRDDEKQAFERLVDHFMRAWSTDPGMHVYHYAPYEPSALKRLAARHQTREDDVDRLLRGERLVDLYAVVRQGLRVSKESYSLKKLEEFYLPSARLGSAVADAASSIVAYERFLATGDRGVLAEIEHYNALDCESTAHLRDWLEQRRAEAASAAGGLLPRPEHTDGAPSANVMAAASRAAAIAERLRGCAGEAATALLAELLDWHRREAKPEWWDYYTRRSLTDEELVDDPAAIGSLGPATWVRDEKRSAVWQVPFPPQDTKLHAGESRCEDPRTGEQAGTIVAVDPVAGWVEIKRAKHRGRPDFRSLVPSGPLGDRVLRDALHRLGEWVADHGVDAPGAWRAGRDLLLRLPPRLVTGGTVLVQPGESASAAVRRLAPALDHSVLAVQGPPGSGKTWTGARMVLDLISAGQVVGVTALSHRAIANLVDAVCAAAAERGRPVRVLQKIGGAGDECTSPLVTATTDNAEVEAALAAGSVDVVAGTSWLFAREQLHATIDTLVVDEAGQLSLANVLAVSGSARNLVLLGDPQQLAQPVKGIHPAGADASALDHLLAGAQTIPASLGVLLDQTWRMHPSVCDFVSAVAYEGRLAAHPDCRHQRLESTGRLTGAGLRWVAVEHEGNRSACTEEAEAIRDLYAELLKGWWIDMAGRRRRLDQDDILVITPYNAQVARLAAILPAGARVGTVDKFQGQEAPAVFYSLATSSAADAPRDLDFLVNLNRFNVAVSRARALTTVVGSPRLLDAPPRSVPQLRQLNALCRFVEQAGAVAPN